MTKRLLNANVSDISNFSKSELKQSIKANEGRTILSENIVVREPLIGDITNSEVAKSFGADLILLNAFDVFNPIVLGMYDYSTMDKAVPNDNVVTDLKKYTGRPIGLNLEPVDLEAEMAEEKLEIAEGRKATKETLEKANKLGFDFVCLTGNPGTGVTNTQIIEAIKIAKKDGLKLPIVYNTNAYENVETLRLLEGYIDIYLPDLKYYYNDLGKKYSKVDNYFDVATNAIKEMYRQVGQPLLDENGIMKKGLMIRHLILPNEIENTKEVLKWIKQNLDNKVFVSIMAQYFPTYMAKNVEKLNRKLTLQEYQAIEDFVFSLDLENGYMQDLGEHEEEYVPKWEF